MTRPRKDPDPETIPSLRLTVMLTPEHMRRLDRFRAAEDDVPGRSEAFRRLLERIPELTGAR